jgi:hypothetical protein
VGAAQNKFLWHLRCQKKIKQKTGGVFGSFAANKKQEQIKQEQITKNVCANKAD